MPVTTCLALIYEATGCQGVKNVENEDQFPSDRFDQPQL